MAKSINSKVKCDMTKHFTPSQRRLNLKNVEVAYYEKPDEEKVMESRAMTPWDKKPFINDYGLFNDADMDMIIDDNFGIVNTNFKDLRYDQKIDEKLKQATPVDFSTEIGEEETNMSRAKTQLDRMIIQDCNYSNGQVRILQPTPAHTCSIPSQYQIDKIATFARTTLKEAQIVSKIYRILDLGFKEVIRINKAIRRRPHLVKPWDIIVNKEQMTLLQLAQEVKKLHMQEQEDPEWAQIDCGAWSERVMDDSAVDYDSDFGYKDYNKYREGQWDQDNPVGEMTYWNNSVILTAQHLMGKSTRKFKALCQKMSDNDMNGDQIRKASLWIKNNCTSTQRKVWLDTVHRVLNINHQIVIEKDFESELVKTA